jgi:hypothetical protein
MSLCKAPFRSLYFNNNRMRPCCWYDQSKLLSSKPSLSDLKNFFEGEEMSEIRDRMLQGEKLPGCQRCWKHEALGGKSHRDFWNHRTFSTDHFSSTPHLKALDIYMGNLCNLKCVSCSSHNSSSWVQDETTLNGKPFLNRIEHVDLSLIPKAVLQDIEWIKFAGGEVLFMKTHLKFLKQLVKMELAERICLNYVTNATVFSKELESLWAKFQKVRVILSIDGTEDVFEYARFPASWSKVNDVISQMKSISNIEFEINTVVSILNAYHLPNILKWRDQSIPSAPAFLRILDFPKQLCLSRLPGAAKEIIIERLQGFSEFKHVVAHLQSMNSEDFSESIQWLSRLDQIRGNSFMKINPWAQDLQKSL